MRKFLGLTILNLCLAGVAFGQSRELSDTGQLLDGIAAIVNEGVVLKSELEEQMAVIVARLRQQNTQLPPRGILESQVLERLIITRIQLQRAERIGIQVSDDILNQALDGVARRNGVAFSDLPRLLAAEGIDYADYREEMRRQMILDNLRQQDVVRRISVTEREINQFLKLQDESDAQNVEYLLSHILITVPSNSTPQQVEQTRQKATDIYDRLNNGEDFSQMAVAYSDGQQALQGGSLGWRKGIQLPTLFSEVVGSMSAGEISEPIRSPSGFHIIRLDDTRGDDEQIMVNQNHCRHILLRPTEILDDEAARKKLEDLRRRIVEDGEDFGALAQQNSEDPVSAKNGGDLGWTSPGTFVGAFEDMVNSMQPGEISEPFKSPFGWHIVELIAKRVHDSTEDLKRNRAVMAIRRSKEEEETELWLRQIRDEAYVDIRI